MRVVFSRQSQIDLDEIWFYLYGESRSEDVADRVINHIRETALRLARNQLIGRSRAEDLGPNLRSIPSGRYVVFYSIVSNAVRIIRVLHGSRDARKLLM